MKEIDEAKLILVGNGGVGKTSLVSSLIKKRDDKTSVTTQHSTRGIDVKQWILSWDVKEQSGNDTNRLQLNIWDFGGQEAYHATHQMFLTNQSLYLVVTDAVSGDTEDDLFYWLNMIDSNAKNSPVIVVMNKIDQRYKELPVGNLQRQFKNIVGFHKVSCVDSFEDTVDSLRADIVRQVSKDNLLRTSSQVIPQSWSEVKENLLIEKEAGRKYLDIAELKAIANKANCSSGNELAVLSNYLHRVGFFLHFQNDFELRRKVFLDPQWVLDAVYKVLDDNEIIASRGVFTDKDLMRVWSDDYTEDVQPELISLMKLFEVCFEINRCEFLAPSLLPREQPELGWNETPPILHFEFRYQYLPNGIMSRFIVRRNRDIKKGNYWRYGALVNFEETEAYIEEVSVNNKIIVKSKGSQKRELLTIIRKTFHEIHNSFHGLLVEEMVPCNCTECVQSNEPFFYSFEKLLVRLTINKMSVECGKSFQDVSISSILDGVDMPSDEKISQALEAIRVKRLNL